MVGSTVCVVKGSAERVESGKAKGSGSWDLRTSFLFLRGLVRHSLNLNSKALIVMGTLSVSPAAAGKSSLLPGGTNAEKVTSLEEGVPFSSRLQVTAVLVGW